MGTAITTTKQGVIVESFDKKIQDAAGGCCTNVDRALVFGNSFSFQT